MHTKYTVCLSFTVLQEVPKIHTSKPEYHLKGFNRLSFYPRCPFLWFCDSFHIVLLLKNHSERWNSFIKIHFCPFSFFSLLIFLSITTRVWVNMRIIYLEREYLKEESKSRLKTHWGKCPRHLINLETRNAKMTSKFYILFESKKYVMTRLWPFHNLL